MDRETFEQLVSEWLDAEEREPLEARLREAAAESAELQAIWRQSRTLHDLLPRVTAAPPNVDWERVAERFATAMDANGEQDVDLDAVLAQLPSFEQRVAWDRFGARVSAAVTATKAATPRRTGRALRLWGAAALATAAAVLLFVLWTPNSGFIPPSATPTGEAFAHVTAVSEGGRRSTSSRVAVSFTVLEDDVAARDVEASRVAELIVSEAPFDVAVVSDAEAAAFY